MVLINEIYQTIVKYQKENRFLPSVGNLCILVNLKSTASVHNNLAKLEKDGLIKIHNNTSRRIQIL
ncbi:LexA family protein [Clostridium celatum]|uniref:LexA DNA binding domain protein n=1 Tax=Clostridium celatum DSM 1785 TaxID=545697 RepID=L1QJB9_9CLOT|nr:LexA DNA-binding domain protein [Clostridium celatum]EKY28109.1 LexA DNA binding domain protein [Clostridium celatum DSM 1785]MCE9654129.1 hypothetical protein [Clostridium celatum]